MGGTENISLREQVALLPLTEQPDLVGRNSWTNRADQSLLPVLEGAGGIWFGGGDQLRTARLLLQTDGTDTPVLAAMRRHAEQAGVEFLAGKVLNAVQMPDAWYVSVGPDMYNARAVVLAAGVARGKKFAGEAELLGRGVSYVCIYDANNGSITVE